MVILGTIRYKWIFIPSLPCLYNFFFFFFVGGGDTPHPHRTVEGEKYWQIWWESKPYQLKGISGGFEPRFGEV